MPSTGIRLISGGSIVLTLGKQFPPEPDSASCRAVVTIYNLLNINVLVRSLVVVTGAKCAHLIGCDSLGLWIRLDINLNLNAFQHTVFSKQHATSIPYATREAA